MTAAVRAVRAGKSYRGAARAALDGVTATVEPGEAVGLLGPNGAGKTTLVKLICGVSRPSAGRLLVFGRAPTEDGGRAKHGIAAVHQSMPFDNMLPLIDNLKIAASFRGLRWRRVRDRVEGMLADFGLAGREGQLTFTLSGGEQRRLQVVRALIDVPRLLLLDEPSAGLDVGGRRQVWEIVTKLTAEHGTTVIWTSHYIEELERHCGRVLILDRGRVVRFCPPATLVAEFGRSTVLVEVAEGADRERLLAVAAGRPGLTATRRPTGIELGGDPVVACLPAVLAAAHAAGVLPTAIHFRSPSLEDAFVELVRAGDGPA
jgi:ABC-2 type transport system ATP-binding protein